MTKNPEIKTHYQEWLKNDIAFVFSCPWRLEEAKEHPAAWKTWENLEELLGLLAESKKRKMVNRIWNL